MEGSKDPLEELDILVRAASTGDVTAMAGLREWLQARPNFWRQASARAVDLEVRLIQATSRGDAILAEALSKVAKEMRGEILSASPTFEERLLADSCVASRLLAYHVGLRCIERLDDVGKLQGWLRSFALTQRTLTSSLKQLASLRRIQRRKSRSTLRSPGRSQPSPGTVAAGNNP